MKHICLELIRNVFLVGSLSLILGAGTYAYSPDSGQNILTAPLEDADATNVAPIEDIEAILVKQEIPSWIIAGPKFIHDDPYLKNQIAVSLPLSDCHRIVASTNAHNELNPIGSKGTRIKSGLKSTGSFTISDGIERYVADELFTIYLLYPNEELPPFATVTNVELNIRIDDNDNELDFFPKDYEIYIGSETNEVCIYDNLGSTYSNVDEGHDDDAENDSDIWLAYRSSSAFDGQDALQYYTVRVSDNHANGEGKVVYVNLRVTWEAPSPNLDVTYTPTNWSAPLVSDHNSGSHTDPPALYAGIATYFMLNYRNWDYEIPDDYDFNFNLLIDGAIEFSANCEGANANGGVIYSLVHLPLIFTAGEHTICQEVDPDNQIWWESNETDNEYCRTLTWVGPPAAPALSAPSNGVICQPTELTLSWYTSANATLYHVQVDDNSDFSSPIVEANVSGTSRYLAGLTPNTTYYWKVLAENPAGLSSYSPSQSFTIAPVFAPATPNLVGPSDGTECESTSPTIYWAGVTHATTYSLQVDDNSDFSSPVFDQSDIAEYSQELSGLSEGVTYFWRTKSANECGNESSWSSSYSFTTRTSTIEPPSLVGPADEIQCQPISPTLSWESQINATVYHVQVDYHSDFSSPEYDATSEDTDFTCEGLSENTIYYWRVCATSNCSITGDWSDAWSFETGSGGMAVPLLTGPANNSIAQPLALTLSWTAVTDATEYQFQLDGDVDFSTPLYNELVTDTSINVTDLVKDSTYFWHVRTNGECSTSDWSDAWQFTTESGAGPDALTENTEEGYSLAQNYPNPFMETTTIEFRLPVDGQVCIDILDMHGRQIESYDGFYTAGKHSIEIKPKGRLQPGVYLYRMKTSDYVNSRMCILR
jgi:hypothetical protein